jgi:hypothetical protein
MLLQVVCTSHGFPSSSTSINRGGGQFNSAALLVPHIIQNRKRCLTHASPGEGSSEWTILSRKISFLNRDVDLNSVGEAEGKYPGKES